MMYSKFFNKTYRRTFLERNNVCFLRLRSVLSENHAPLSLLLKEGSVHSKCRLLHFSNLIPTALRTYKRCWNKNTLILRLRYPTMELFLVFFKISVNVVDPWRGHFCDILPPNNFNHILHKWELNHVIAYESLN